ncbi:MAG: flagellar protein [Lachnospiraceae bacterium]|nr:flagellar protein [Lachnospiraceae bacterium]
MDLKTCRRCRRLFNYISGPMICPDCVDELEKKFYDVKEYIRENPKVGIKKVSIEMNVPVSQIQQWVREERLQFTEDSGIALECEKCGKNIYTGRYCDACKAKMANSLSRALGGAEMEAMKPSSTGNRMRSRKF